MAPPGAFTLSPAQVERIKEITNQRGAGFNFPVSGALPIPAPYSYVQAFLDSNQLTIKVLKHTGTVIAEKRPGQVPIPQPPSEELDALINSVVDRVERQIQLKPKE